jgi:Flp pilus assembly protein TadG
MRLSPLRRSRLVFRAPRERGASAVLTVVLLVPVLLGAMALSFDVGQLMWERRQLQNGADAAVVLAARTCMTTPASCPTGGTTPLVDRAKANEADAETNIAPNAICGNAAAQAWAPALLANPACADPPPAGVTECAPCRAGSLPVSPTSS